MTEAIEAPLHQFSPSPSDKLSFWFSPPQLPAVCWICNGSPDGVKRFADISMQQEYYGAVYICSDCWTPLVEGLGFVRLELFETLQEKHAELKSIARMQGERIRELEQFINSLRNFRPDLDTSVLDSTSVEESGQGDSNITESVGTGKTDDDKSIESDSSGGPENSPVATANRIEL